MRIKFKAPDPRAGTSAQMDSSRGQHFIDSGAAVQVKDDESEESAPAALIPAEPAVVKTPVKPKNKASK